MKINKAMRKDKIDQINQEREQEKRKIGDTNKYRSGGGTVIRRAGGGKAIRK